MCIKRCFYVAGRFEERAKIAKVMGMLEARGHTISYRWVDQTPSADPDVLAEQALLDYEGVLNCTDILVIPSGKYMHVNAHAELGIALGSGKVVHVVSKVTPWCIFVKLPQVRRYNNMKQFLKELDA